MYEYVSQREARDPRRLSGEVWVASSDFRQLTDLLLPPHMHMRTCVHMCMCMHMCTYLRHYCALRAYTRKLLVSGTTDAARHDAQTPQARVH